MRYRNSEIKIDQLINYLTTDKINLSPAFQRGHVWTTKARRKLIKNMLQDKPIPAIFLYKDASGTKYSYNILDGKQRLESIILFIGSARADGLRIGNWSKYFSNPIHRRDANFWVDFDGRKKRVRDLDDDKVRDFNEYVLPAIEITLDDETSLDEIISLFVDINQQGSPVKRFDIVKAIYRNDTFLKQVFKLIAISQRRRQDVRYKAIRNSFTFVLKRLSMIQKAPETNLKVDKMWERLLEIAIFTITRVHKKPVNILKEFIKQKVTTQYALLSEHLKRMKEVFEFIKKGYSQSQALSESKFATDNTHFYTMITTLINSALLSRVNHNDLINKLAAFANIVGSNSPRRNLSSKLKSKIKRYIELSSKHTTDTSNRIDRETLFKKIINSIL